MNILETRSVMGFVTGLVISSVTLCGLMISTLAVAKKDKIYSCKQADGSIVMQDRRCAITDLQNSSLNSGSKSRKNNSQLSSADLRLNSKKPPNKKSQIKTTQSSFRKTRNQATKPGANQAESGRSPYFTFGWDRFIPANWMNKTSAVYNYTETLLSKKKFNNQEDFYQGVKLAVYANTLKESNIVAFAQALQLYHKIRDVGSYQLLDSQFKSHPRFKVFNIKYMQNKELITTTEFYIDERHNDLFVVTVQATQSQWSSYWDMAERIINQL